MLTLKKVAITGALASGKSTVLKLFEEMGACVLDTDKIVHDLLTNRPDIQLKVVRLLGDDVKDKNGLNRTKIAQIVFEDPLLLSDLEKILHPHVRNEVQKKYQEALKEKKWSAFVVEVPLLFETEPDDTFDATLVVYADEALCFKRFQTKTKQTKREYDARMNRQMPPKQKLQLADYVLYNDGNLENLKRATKKIYSQITQ